MQHLLNSAGNISLGEGRFDNCLAYRKSGMLHTHIFLPLSTATAWQIITFLQSSFACSSTSWMQDWQWWHTNSMWNNKQQFTSVSCNSAACEGCKGDWWKEASHSTQWKLQRQVLWWICSSVGNSCQQLLPLSEWWQQHCSSYCWQVKTGGNGVASVVAAASSIAQQEVITTKTSTKKEETTGQW